MEIREVNGQQVLVLDNGQIERVVQQGRVKETGEVAVKGESGKNYILPYQPTAGDYAQQVLGQGLAMGWGDEISAAARSAYDAATTDAKFSDAYKKNITDVRRDMAGTEKALGPLATFGLQTGGAFLTGGLGLGRQLAGRGLSLGAKALRGSAMGGAQGAVTGAGMAEDVQSIPASAGAGFAGGAFLGGAMPAVTHGVVEGGRALGRMFPGGASRQAASVVRDAMPEGSLPQVARAANRDKLSVVADYLPEDPKRVATSALRNIGSGPERKFLRARHRSQEARLSRAINEQISGEDINTTISRITDARRNDALRDYGEIYDKVLPETDELKSVLDNPGLKKYWAEIKDLAEVEGAVLPDEWADARIIPSVGVVDAIKRGLDDVVSSLYKQGYGTRATALAGLRNRLRAEADRLVPEYAEARSVYAGHSAALEAAENGRKFMLTLGDEGKGLKGFQRSDIANLGDHEYEAFVSGAASALRDKVERKGFGADVTKLFDNPGFKKDLNALLGRDRARQFRSLVKGEQLKAETYAATQGSQTAANLAAEKASIDNTVNLTEVARRALNALQPQPKDVAAEISRMYLSPKAANKAAGLAALQPRGLLGPTISRARGLAEGGAGGVGGYTGGLLGSNIVEFMP